MKLKYLIVPSLMALSLAACGNKDTVKTDGDVVEVTETKVEKKVQAKPELGTFGVALADMDESVKPGDNFFKYVNGTWLKNTEMPADKSRYGAFNVLRDRSDDNVKIIIEEAAAKNAAKGSEEQKIGDFYAAFMDTETIEAKGLAPVKAIRSEPTFV